MNTKFLMTISALIMAIVGLCCSFFPQEISLYVGVNDHIIVPLMLQVLGATYLGFAILNFMAKANLIGGIYSKPVAIGNFMHYMAASLALIKFFISHSDLKFILIPLIIYSIFALLFGKVAFGSPL